MRKLFQILNRIAYSATGKHAHDYVFPGTFTIKDGVPMMQQTCSICGEKLETILR